MITINLRTCEREILYLRIETDNCIVALKGLSVSKRLKKRAINFLRNYVNYYDREIEELEEQIFKIKEKIDSCEKEK